MKEDNIERKFCPFAKSSSTPFCRKSSCELWIGQTGTCSITVVAAAAVSKAMRRSIFEVLD